MAMMLSEAMRLGAMATGQCYGVLCDDVGNTCAIGSVIYASGGIRGAFVSISIFYELAIQIPDQTWIDIVEKNNKDRMTREQIADWLVDSGKDVELFGFGESDASRSAEVPVCTHA